MAPKKDVWDPKLRGTNIKGTNLKSLNLNCFFGNAGRAIYAVCAVARALASFCYILGLRV